MVKYNEVWLYVIFQNRKGHMICLTWLYIESFGQHVSVK